MQIPRKMSAHNVVASLTRTLGNRNHGPVKTGNEVKLAGEESKDKLYEPKYKPKIVRVLTVVAYIISVSLAAIVLSLYYMYIWDPSDHPHNIAKQKSNVTTLTPNTSKPPCVDVTPNMDSEVVSSNVKRFNGTFIEITTPLTPIIMDSSRVTDNANLPQQQQAGKSLYKTLTTPARDGDYATDLPLMPSISSDQYQTVPDDYRDSTIIPNDDTMDD